MVIELDESERLTEAELNFRLKGKTNAGRRWNREYQIMIDEYETGLFYDDPGWASSTAAEVSKCYNGMQRKLRNLAKSTEGQRMVGLQ